MKYPSGKGKTLFQQKFDIEKKFPFIKCTVHLNILTCTGNFNSSLTNNIYKVKIIKKSNKSPKVFILNNDIIKKHMYPDGSLCLYHFKNFIWDDNYWISDYQIPWIAAWIYFYEAWIITGEWFAEEEPHGDKPKIFKE